MTLSCTLTRPKGRAGVVRKGGGKRQKTVLELFKNVKKEKSTKIKTKNDV